MAAVDTGKTNAGRGPKNLDATGKILAKSTGWGSTILFLRKRFVLYLEPDRVALVRGQEAIVHASVQHDPAAGDISWDKLGAAMQDVLLRRRHRRGDRGEIDVVLSESLCQLGLVKGDTGSLSATESAAVAQHCFRTRLPAGPDGSPAALFRVAPVRGGAGRRQLLCAALDAAGYDQIRRAVPGGVWSLRALRPRLVAFAADLGRALDRFSGHLVCADGRSAVLVAMREGNWLQVMTRRTGPAGPAQDSLAQMLEQSEALSATGSREVWWCGEPAPARHLAGWTLRPAMAAGMPAQ